MKKNIILLLFISFYCTMMHSQSSERYSSDADFNYSKSALYINDTFVKSFIGFNLKGKALGVTNMRKNDNPLTKKPIVINGVTYKGKIVIECTKKIKFVTLKDIRKQYCPNVSGNVVYMINKFFVMSDAKSYKLDKDFIDRCEVLKSSDFDLFKGKMQFSIIRVFTKDHPRPPMRLR